MNINEDKVENTPAGGALIGKRKGQTMIHNKGSMSGYLVGKTHAEGGIKAINKSTGQPLEMQGGEVVITAPAVSDQTKHNFDGKMMTNREILSTINERGGGVAFAQDGMEIPKKIKRTGASYNYGGRTMTDHEIYKYITGGGIAEEFSIRDIADIHQIPLAELKEEVRIGMLAESEHKGNAKDQMEIVKDHLLENPKYYTLLKKAGLVEEKKSLKEKSKWLQSFYITNNPSIDKLLIDLQPKIEELIEKQKELVIKITTKLYGKPVPMTDSDIQLYEAGLIFKMVQSFNKFIKNTDELYDVSINKRGGLFEVNSKVKRDGRTYRFDTELIGAGGYNIQEYHYRYIIKTDLPSSNENSAVENIKAKMGVLKKIRTIDEDIARYTKNIERFEQENIDGFVNWNNQIINLSADRIEINKRYIQDYHKDIKKLEVKKADLISVFESLDKKGVGVNFGKQVKEAIGSRILVDRLRGSKYKETGDTLDFKIENRTIRGKQIDKNTYENLGSINTFSFVDEGNGLCTMKAGLELRGKYTLYAEYKNLPLKEIPYKINEIFNGEFEKYLQYEVGGGIDKKFKYSREFSGITIYTNVEQEYVGNNYSPFDKKGSFEATITKGSLENIALESKYLKNFNFKYGVDNWNTISKKLKDKKITKLELYQVGKYVKTFELKPLNEEYINGGEFNPKPFLDYYFEEIKDFLKDQNNVVLDSDFTFRYRGEFFTIEPLIEANKDSEQKIKTAHFIILDQENEVVGEITFNPDDSKPFEAYSEYFEWNNINFYGGGETTKVVTYRDKYNKKYNYPKNTSHTLEEISKDTNVSVKGLQQIYNKGIGAYKTNPSSVRPNVKSKEQWAMARVYSAVMGGKASKVDSNELKMSLGGGMSKVPLRIVNKVKKLSDRILEIEKMNLGNDIYSYDGDLSFKQRAKLIEEQEKLQNELTEITDELSKEQCYSIDSESFRALNTAGDFGYEDNEYKVGGEVGREDLVKDSKRGNTPARDLNNYNDLMDVGVDSEVGGNTGLFDNGGTVNELKIDKDLLREDFEQIKNSPLFRSSYPFLYDNNNSNSNGVSIKIEGSQTQYDPSSRNYETFGKYSDSRDVLEALAQMPNRNYSYRVRTQTMRTEEADNVNELNRWDDSVVVNETEFYLIPEKLKKQFATGGGVNKKEYEYVLTQRPFGIGTYPTKDFLRFEDRDFNYGVLVYSQPVPLNEIEHYSLSPITELKEYDDKILDYKIGKLNLKARVKLILDNRKGYFVNLFISDDNGILKTQPMSGVKFLEEIKNGKLVSENINNYENKTLDELIDIKKSKYSNMPIDSFKSDDEKLLDKLIAEKFSKIQQEIIEKRKKEKSFESEGSTEGKGKLYEFFTPQVVADKMLALAQHYGFKGGNVLEPATGSGRLIKHLKDTNITAFEISKDNFEILKREFPNAELYNYNFEKAFLKEPRFNTLLNRKGTETWLKGAPFDLVLANPPYGKFSGMYSSYFNFKGQVEHFFILQTLYLLKKGGLGVYLIPSSFLRNGVSYNNIKKQIFEIAEFVDAYRLPSNIFEKTQIGTDILILRKK